MIEHLLWEKDGDRHLGTRNAYEVASAFGNSQTGRSGLLGQSCFSESWPASWASTDGLLFAVLAPHSSHTLICNPSLLCLWVQPVPKIPLCH